MNGRCCVFQPFDDGGPYDKRYDDVVSPAIEAADLEPYRVDRDVGAVIPIDTLHDEIRKSSVCLADITHDNPNVWYELGYAAASGHSVVMICAKDRKLPFDIHHRKIIFYTAESPRDFKQLGSDITNHLQTVLARQTRVQEMVEASPVKPTEGLNPHEIAVLVFLLAYCDSLQEWVQVVIIKDGMRRAGYTDVATKIGLATLERSGYVKSEHEQQDFETVYHMCNLTPKGEDWLIHNQDKIRLRVETQLPPVDQGITDDDVPF